MSQILRCAGCEHPTCTPEPPRETHWCGYLNSLITIEDDCTECELEEGDPRCPFSDEEED